MDTDGLIAYIAYTLYRDMRMYKFTYDYPKFIATFDYVTCVLRVDAIDPSIDISIIVSVIEDIIGAPVYVE